jgi:hypothetical protein
LYIARPGLLESPPHFGSRENMPSQDESKSGERRSNLVLRALIDEMLDRVRDLNRDNGFWTPDERARAEAELESIMARVRRVAAAKEAAGTDTTGQGTT